jgi:nicotinate-nucleotide pyrophosphorylase (carboxylating)
MNPAQEPVVRRAVQQALEEDVGRGDVTSALTLPPGLVTGARLLAEEPCVIAGGFLVPMVYQQVDATVAVECLVADGSAAGQGTAVARVHGAAASILTGERVALNFLQHLSGIATLTRRYVDAVAGTGAAIVDTRKTVPGLRLLEKHAVRMGGGVNHRFALDDAVLIKNTHVALGGGTAAVVQRARAAAPAGLQIQVECRSAAEVEAALAAGADGILLDNRGVDEARALVRLVAGKVPVEISGGVNLQTVRAYAETGVDRISIGALTHSAPAIALHLRIEAPA